MKQCITMSKYQGNGREYLILDPNRNEQQLLGKKLEPLCMRSLGICADEILFGPVMKDGKPEVRVFSLHEGETALSEGDVLAFAKYLADEQYVTGKTAVIVTPKGERTVEVPADISRVEELSVAENFFS